MDFESRTEFAEKFTQEVNVYPGLEKTKDYCIAMESDSRGAVVNYTGQVLTFKINEKSNIGLSYEQNLKFPIGSGSSRSKHLVFELS